MATHGRAGFPARTQDRWAAPALVPQRRGPAERFAARLSGRHPAIVFFAALLSGFALLALASVALGLLVTQVLLDELGLAGPDQDAVEAIVAERSPFLTDASWVGSFLGGAPWLPILVGVVALVCAINRRWLIAAFAVFVLTAESATYRVTSWLVPRERPDVKRLDDLPVDASYPSGHTAAALAVYGGLVLLLTSRMENRALKVALWVVALVMPVIVALSRMYRGMHHPIDAAAGLLVGIGAILVLLFACRAAELAKEWRS